jgi:hypothetical protein
MTARFEPAQDDWRKAAFNLARLVIEGAPASELSPAAGRLVGFLYLCNWGDGCGADLAQALALTVKAATSYALRDQSNVRASLNDQARALAESLQIILRLESRGAIDPLAVAPVSKKKDAKHG